MFEIFTGTISFNERSGIIVFFQKNSFKILKNFRKSKSLFRVSKINLPIKLINLIQKNGKKITYINNLVKALDNKHYLNLNITSNIWVYFFNIFLYFNPTFSYIISKADKKKRKNSRNKIQKYFFIWKYIPEYKRFRIFLKFFAKELKFVKVKTLYKKISSIILKLILNKHFFFENYIQFCNKHIYYNLQNKVLYNYLESR